MKIIGILLVLNSIGLTAWWVTAQSNYRGAAITLCLIAVFAGLALVLQDRITELTIKNVGTIKAATKQAQSDAKSIDDILKRVENQSATVDLVATEASKAKEISEEVADKNRIAEEKLVKLDEAIAQVKKLAVALSDAIASSLATSDNPFRYIHLKYKIKQIENIRGILQKLDIPEDEIEEALDIITSRVVHDHMKRILHQLNARLPKENKLFKNIDEINIDSWNLERVHKTLIENDVKPEGELQESILDLEYFKENKKLRREDKWQG